MMYKLSITNPSNANNILTLLLVAGIGVDVSTLVGDFLSTKEISTAATAKKANM